VTCQELIRMGPMKHRGEKKNITHSYRQIER
jgi:hypothetical protein